MKKAGESDDRLFAVAAWRDTPYFTDAERSALALTESVTRLADRADAVPDAVWNEAAKHWTETQLAALVIQIAMINAFNRINAAVRQDAGAIRGRERAYRFQNPCEGMRNARLKRDDAFSHEMIIVSSAIVSSS